MIGNKKTTSMIHTERYNVWKGELQSRRKIIFNTIWENFNYNIHNKWIIAILILTWIFIVFFPLLGATFNENILMEEPSSTNQEIYEIFDFSEIQNIEFLLSKTIQKNENATYDLAIMNIGDGPDDILISLIDPENKADEGWNGYFIINGENHYNYTFPLNVGELVTFQLIIIPPPELESGKGEAIITAISKGTGEANFQGWDNIIFGSQIRTITYVGKAELSSYQFKMNILNENITTKPKKQVEFNIEIQNTGIKENTYSLSVHGLNEEWDYSFEGVDKFEKNNNASVFLKPNEKRTLRVIFDVPKFPAKTNNIGILATSNDNERMAKNTIIRIEVTDIPKKDITGEVITGLYGGMFILFVILLSTVVGSKAISNDLSQKSFTIYFARPIKKLDYVIIKYGSLVSTLALITFIPILITYLGFISLTNVDFDYFVDHLWVWGAILIHSLLFTVVFTSVALAFSSFTKRRIYGAIGLIVTYFITLLLGIIIVGEFNNEYGSAISIPYSLVIVGDKIFNVSDVAHDYSWYFNLLTLLIITILASFAVILKISRTELSE